MAKAKKPKKEAQTTVDPSTLSLDLENPRLTGHEITGRITERDVIQHLVTFADIAELVQSIAANGYLDFEPLVVMKVKRGPKQILTVIEGNRRVAAIKLLKDPDLANQLSVALPEVSAEVLASLKKASFIEVKDRKEARQYIGFKHINGPHKWDSFAKAKFAADWFRAEQASGVTLRDIARKLGDRHDTVLRLVQGVFVVEQATAAGLFEVEDRYQKRPFAFSHLYTALTRLPYREYLGLPPKWREYDPTPDPVPVAKLKNLEKVLLWLYGSETESTPPVVTSQNPHIKQLGEVLANPLALKKLEASNSLAAAFSEVDTRSRKFSDNLLKAVDLSQSAQTFVDGYDGEKALLEFGDRLQKIAKTVFGQMKATVEEAEPLKKS